MGGEATREHIATLMGERGPDVNPVETDWGMSPEAQAQLAKVSAMMPAARAAKRD